MPTDPVYGASFVPVVSTNGDGTTSVTSSTPLVCTDGPTVSFLTSGTCTLVAHVTAGTTFTAADGTPQSVTVGKVAQAISFSTVAPANAIVGGPNYVVAATGGASGDAVIFSSATPSVCLVTGSTVSFIGQGTCTIDADQSGNANYLDAPQVEQSFFVSVPSPPPSPPRITSTCPTTAIVGQNYGCVIATTGFPVPTITIASLPSGLKSFQSSSLSITVYGVPTIPGTYLITIAAANNQGLAQQTFTLVVEAGPVFTSADHASIPARMKSTISVTAPGTPTPVITASGLRKWIKLTDNRDGTATLTARRPGIGTFTFTLRATNAVGTANQTFTLTVKG